MSNDVRGLAWDDLGQPVRFILIVLCFLLLGPPLGYIAMLFGMEANFIWRWGRSSLVDNPLSAVFFYFVTLPYAYVLGALSAFISGLCVAIRSWRPYRISRSETLFCGAILVPIATDLVLRLFVNKGRLTTSFTMTEAKGILAFAAVTTFATLICTFLSRRRQGPPRH